jgi:hypothetical protein|tara:strand:- start:3818 stop:4213 length:396 start_codon:yes stop_codon:yes gene_type:complete
MYICTHSFRVFLFINRGLGLHILFITGIIFFANITIKNDILVLIFFSLSACNFWPFTHIFFMVHSKEKRENTKEKTFDTNFALSILALSLPISVSLILGILAADDTFTNINNILILVGMFMRYWDFISSIH